MFGAAALGSIPYAGLPLTPVVVLPPSEPTSPSSSSMSQTSIQKLAAIRKGSVKVQVGDDFSSLVDIGALRNPVFTAVVENQEIIFDNVDSLKKFVNGNKVEFSFDLAEINLTNMAKLDAGLVTLTTQAASPVSITDELHTLAADSAVRLNFKNGANTRVASIAVNAAGGGASKAEGTDYEVIVDAEGYTSLAKIGTGTLAVEVDYTYTPLASKTITLSASGNKTLKAMRITNTDENGKVFKIDIQDVTNLSAISIKFASDTAQDVALQAVQMKGTLVEIVDEQQVT